MAKNNNSKTTSLSNNGIQDLKTLAKVDKHNIRKYDEDDEDIEIIKGTNKLIDDVKELYKSEFDESRIEYNLKQVREDRKINDYFTHISNNSKSDLACEIIIELSQQHLRIRRIRLFPCIEDGLHSYTCWSQLRNQEIIPLLIFIRLGK